ncbi:MAG: DUF4112 domain-containing protein, partial [Caulobacteraceae bacterium]|nr:DUF4112 domain-containing protein [Caulobacteraceae bacterium]
RGSIERTKKLSDNVVGVGPLGVGLDAVLNLVPAAGAIYSLMAGLLLLLDGIRAKAAPMVLVQMAGILAVDTIAPMTGNKLGLLADVLFTGHKWSADMLLKHMEETIYFEGTREEALNSAEYRDLMARVRAGKESRRVVFLGGEGRRKKPAAPAA